VLRDQIQSQLSFLPFFPSFLSGKLLDLPLCLVFILYTRIYLL
jgi:hypothetical protein